MASKNSATVHRSGKTGQFVVRKSGGEVSTHTVSATSARRIRENVDTHKEALKRLAKR